MENQPRRFPRFLSARKVPLEVKAAIAKLQADPHTPTTKGKNVRLPDSRVLAHVANTTIGNIRDAKNLFQVLPEMDYAREVIISATLSPGDLTSTDLIYTVKDDELDSSLTGPMLRQIQEFFDDSYRIRSLLHPILNDVLFETGSYPILVLPESSIDHIINAEQYSGVGMESAIQALNGHIREETDEEGRYIPWGILGGAGQATPDRTDSYTGVSFESLQLGKQHIPTIDTRQVSVSLENLAPNEASREAFGGLAKKVNGLFKAAAPTIEVVDNLNILKRPLVVETKRKIAVNRIYGAKLHRKASLESKADGGDGGARQTLKQIEQSFYSRRKHQHIPVQPVLTQRQTGTKSYGHPLVMHIPSEAVIVVHTPGNPAEHVGYYVLLDVDGYPISVADQNSYYDDIKAQMNNVDGYASQIMQQARRGFEGMGGLDHEIIDEMGKVHAEAVEGELLTRLRSGVLSGNYELGKVENINRLMLARHLKGQKTHVLFVPAELMNYIAFDYNEFGIGKSLLEDGKILGSIRAALMLANTLATLNNAVGGKTIEITLDPEDEDPVSTVEFLLSEHAKVNAQGFSRIVGSTHPLGLADQIQNHGVNVVVSGNTRYPETRMEVNGREGVNRPIDTDMEEEYRKRHIQMFGLSPEVMEGINQTDFATTVVQNNLMLLKRVMRYQEKFIPFLTDFVRSYTLNSGVLQQQLREFIIENKQLLPEEWREREGFTVGEAADEFIYAFVNALDVSLAAPEIDTLAKQMEGYDTYSDAIDKALDAYLSEEMFAADTSLGMEELIPTVKAVTKAEFQRRYLRKHNILAELDVFNTVTEDGDSPAFDLLEAAAEHLDGINGSIAGYIEALIDAAKEKTRKLQLINKAKEELEDAKNNAGGDDFAGGGGDGDYGSDDTGGGEDGLGGDDFNMDEAGEGDLGGMEEEEELEEAAGPDEDGAGGGTDPNAEEAPEQ